MKKIKDLDKKILSVLKKQKNPVSTRFIALETGFQWHTVYTMLLKLQNKDKVNSFQSGIQHLWYV